MEAGTEAEGEGEKYSSNCLSFKEASGMAGWEVGRQRGDTCGTLWATDGAAPA